MHFLEVVGRFIQDLLEGFGRFFELVYRTALGMLRPPYDVKALRDQLVRVGVDSVPVVFLTTLFTGAVMALQTFNGFARFNADYIDILEDWPPSWERCG